MSEKKKGLLINFAIGAVITVAVIALRWSMNVSFLQKLCDGLFVAGVLILGIGGLKFFRNQGAFDMMSYSISYVFYTTFPSAKMNRPEELQDEEFYEYKLRKRSERKSSSGLVIPGAVFMALSMIALVVLKATEG